MNLFEIKDKFLNRAKELGFQDPEKCYYLAKNLLERIPDVPREIMALIESCRESVSPDRSLLGFSGLLEHAISPYSRIKEILNHPWMLKAGHVIFASSEYLSTLIFRSPLLFYRLFENGILTEQGPKEWNEEIGKIFVISSDENFIKALNQFKAAALLRICARELLGMDTMFITAYRLSQLADLILETVYKKNKVLFPNTSLAVISLGKLGSREANFSSDLDLIFVGQNKTAESDKFGQKMIADLSLRTSWGYLYRIDMRLRPEGSASSLVTSLEYIEDYLGKRARSWERQAYLRARFSAGDAKTGEKAVALISSFVFQNNLTVEDIRSIIFTRKKIDNSVSHNPLGHVKKGSGGIRDIEFIVQAFQLIFGKALKELQNANIFQAISLLYQRHFLNQEQHGLLSGTYVFLRRIEHYLQLYDDRQVFEIPENPERQRLLARLLGFDDAASFFEHYRSLREKVRTVFLDIFARLFGEGRIAAVSEIALNPEMESESANELLKPYGIRDTQSVFHFLRSLSEISPDYAYSLALSLHSVLEEIKESPDPEKTLFRMFDIMQAYGASSMFLRLIREDFRLKKMMLQIIAASELLTSIVTENPGLLDAFMDPESLFMDDSLPEIYEKQELKYPGKTLSHKLRAVYREIVFKNALREFSGNSGWKITGRNLSNALEFCLQKVAEKLESKESAPLSYALIAMGRLGCQELGYGSDADVIFVYDDVFERKIRYTRFFQEWIEMMRPVIEIDARLRPYGKNSALVISKDKLYEYFDSNHEIWEKAAYVKARVIVSRGMDVRGLEERMAAFVTSGDRSNDARAIAELRRKIKNAFDNDAGFNIKKSAGGSMDLDFIAFLLLRKGDRKDFLRSTYDLLNKLEEVECAACVDFYSRMGNALKIIGEGNTIKESSRIPLLSESKNTESWQERLKNCRIIVVERLKMLGADKRALKSFAQ